MTKTTKEFITDERWYNIIAVRLASLEYQLKLLLAKFQKWTGEYNAHGPKGTKQSSMTKTDLQFLEGQINRIKKAAARVAELIDQAAVEIDNRFN